MSKKKTFTKVALPVVVKYARDEEFREKVASAAEKIQHKVSAKTHTKKKKHTVSKSKVTVASVLGVILTALIWNKSKKDSKAKGWQ